MLQLFTRIMLPPLPPPEPSSWSSTWLDYPYLIRAVNVLAGLEFADNGQFDSAVITDNVHQFGQIPFSSQRTFVGGEVFNFVGAEQLEQFFEVFGYLHKSAVSKNLQQPAALRAPCPANTEGSALFHNRRPGDACVPFVES